MDSSKPNDRLLVCTLFAALVRGGVLTAEQFTEGVYLFLNEFEDLILDTPKLLGHMATVLARCATLTVGDGVALLPLSRVVADSDANLFASSTKLASMVGEALKCIAQSADMGGVPAAAAVYKESGVDLSTLVLCGPRESAEEAVSAFLAKYNIAAVVAEAAKL